MEIPFPDSFLEDPSKVDHCFLPENASVVGLLDAVDDELAGLDFSSLGKRSHPESTKKSMTNPPNIAFNFIFFIFIICVFLMRIVANKKRFRFQIQIKCKHHLIVVSIL